MWRSPRRGAREFFGASPRCNASELWSALLLRRVQLHKARPCSSASSPDEAPATWPTEEAAVRLTGAHVALGAASVLVSMLFPDVDVPRHGALAVYAIVLLGCAAVLLSPAHRAVADVLARRAAEAASWKISRVLALHSNTALRWAGFTCIVLCAVGDVVRPKEAAAAKEVAIGLVLFLLFLVGVWTVSLSMVTEEEHEGGELDDGTAALAARDDDVSKVCSPENEEETSLAC